MRLSKRHAVRKGNRGVSPAADRRPFNAAKGRRVLDVGESSSSSSQKNRRKLSANSGITRIPDCPRTLPSPNRFEPFRASSCSFKRKNRKKPSSVRDYRKWVYSAGNCASYKDKFLVVSYNILGVDNVSKHPDLYHRVPHKFLKWNRRKELIHREINDYNASILCFQEVDRFDDLEDLFRNSGYNGIYKARTGEACDGCAIFWKDKSFTLLHQENIEFRDFGLRDNVAQLCVLKMKETQPGLDLHGPTSSSQTQGNRSLLVCNIHVLFNPNRGDIKLAQVRLLLEKAYKLSKEWSSIPIIIAGDLNSLPKSAIYQFLASSELDVSLLDRRKISGQLESQSQCSAFRLQSKDAANACLLLRKSPYVLLSGKRLEHTLKCPNLVSRPTLYGWSDEELRIATGCRDVTHVRHRLKLCSAYFGVSGSCKTRDDNGEPLATSYHSKFMGTVDYIWHSKELVPVRVLETLPIDELRRTGLPNEKWASDHLALVCELAFLDDGDDKT